MLGRRALLGALAAWLVAAATHAETPIVGPTASAAQIRAAAGAASRTVTRVVFDLRPDADTPEPIQTTVDFAPTYVAVAFGKALTLYDFRLKRAITIDAAHQSFANQSLYATIGYRAGEMATRRATAAVAAKVAQGKALPEALKPFWREAALGFRDREAPRPGIGREAAPDGTLRFALEDQEVARFVPAAQEAPPSFVRYLRWTTALHPEVLAAIAETRHLPQELTYARLEAGKRHQARITLRSVESVAAEYPLPSAALPDPFPGMVPDIDTAEFRLLLPLLNAAVERRAGDGPPTVASYRAAIEGAFDSGKRFAAGLLSAELVLQHGERALDCPPPEAGAPPCRSLRDIVLAAEDDPRMATLALANLVEARDPEKAIELRRGMKRDDVPNGYLVDYYLANALSLRSLRAEAIERYGSALRGNPYIPAFTRDFGSHFLRNGRADLAWLAFDLGRKLPVRPDPDPWEAIDRLEEELAAMAPQFF